VPQTAREFVQLGVPLHEVWASVRNAHRQLVDRLLTACLDLVPASGHALEVQQMFRLAFEAAYQYLSSLAAQDIQRWTLPGSRTRSGGGSGWSTRWPGWMCCSTGSVEHAGPRPAARPSGMRGTIARWREETWPVV
jgi:hypothetical protein